MEIDKLQSVIESILFCTGRIVTLEELCVALESSADDIEKIVQKMQEEYKSEDRGIELVRLNGGYQLCTKKENYEYIYQIIDKRSKPKLSNAALETLAIIAYNPKISRPEIEAIRGVNVDGTMYKLMEYGLIEEAGKSDMPGRPMSYQTTNEFLKMFGYGSLDELPDLPRYKMDENHQIVIDELVDNEIQKKQEENESGIEEKNESKYEQDGI